MGFIIHSGWGKMDIAANGFWVIDLNISSLMCKFLILMPPLIDTPVVTESTSWRRSGTMNSE